MGTTFPLGTTATGVGHRFVLMPQEGFRVTEAHGPRALLARVAGFQVRAPITLQPSTGIEVLDRIGRDGPQLVELSDAAFLGLRAGHPDVRLIALTYYHPAVAPRVAATSLAAATGGGQTTNVTFVITSEAGEPLAGCEVVAFTDWKTKHGAQGTTGPSGQVSMIVERVAALERVYVYGPVVGFWGRVLTQVAVQPQIQAQLPKIALDQLDCLRHFYASLAPGDGSGVTVGVVDTGIAQHPDLVIDGGQNTVLGESASDFGDNGNPHGTHVAGIIASRGKLPTGLPGIAPAVRLRSYRPYPFGQNEADSFAIAKAISVAVADGCDLINLSLESSEVNEALQRAIAEAWKAGSLCIAAAGNGYRNPVSFPASEPLAVAVSALGRIGTFPADSTESGDAIAPFGDDQKHFIAGFSNVGPEIALIAPGVGILSSVAGGYGAMSGTSMACPVTTGAAARMLARRQDISNMPRNQDRAGAIAAALYASAKTLGFDSIYQGHGLPA